MFYLILFLPPLYPDSDLDPNKKLGVRIRIHMNIFGILDPDPHENLFGSETLPACIIPVRNNPCGVINKFLFSLASSKLTTVLLNTGIYCKNNLGSGAL